ncbi:calmodulin-binding protein 25-like [Phoenix dactylifera]|uniref:Calmodulin-binding protein 25-like n=1 Tax=Phoenix dactylifera TaxID=42345 RepID=A0A8B7CXK9_PHODC|nr:calmodulin-binding protein 25-like [Phoenix dactylifera]
MANNCSTVEPRTSWISETFARENEALTKALQISPSDNSPPSSSATAAAISSFLHRIPAADRDSPSSRRRNPIPCPPSGKISKRKSRASKRLPTTYINADPANFRQMVQQVTGVRLDNAGMPVEPVLKPEPLRPAVGLGALQQSCLPTLHASGFLLDRDGLLGPGAAVGGPVIDFDPFASFAL